MSAAWYEKAAVSLGLLGEHEVGDGSDLSAELLTERFRTEACSLKEPRKNSGGFLGGCSNPQIADGPDPNDPSASDIDAVLQSWLTRLKWETRGDTAVDALLHSKSVDVVLQTLTTCRSGRTAIQVAAQTCSGGECQRPLGVVLVQLSAVPVSLLGNLLKLLVEAIDVVDQCRESGMQSEESAAAERGRQWVLTLLYSALRDMKEVPLLRKGSAVDAVDRAFPLLTVDCKPSAPERILDRVETWSRIFQELKDLCEKMAGAKKKVTSCEDIAQQTLTATVESLSKFRDSMERTKQSLRSARGKKLFGDASRASMELEAMVTVRAEKARLIAGALPHLHEHHEGIAALCMKAESERRCLLTAIHAELHRVLWGPQADVLWQDGTSLPVIRAMVKRTYGLVEQARIEMVHLAAQCLDDQNALFAKSEEMSRAGSKYKELRSELQKSAERLSKMEEAANMAAIKQSASSATPASLWNLVTPILPQEGDLSAEDADLASKRRNSMHDLHKMLCLAAGYPEPPMIGTERASEETGAVSSPELGAVSSPEPAPKACSSVSQKSGGPTAAPTPELTPPASMMVTAPGGISPTPSPPQPIVQCTGSPLKVEMPPAEVEAPPQVVECTAVPSKAEMVPAEVEAIGLHLRYDGKLQLTYGAANEDLVLARRRQAIGLHLRYDGKLHLTYRAANEAGRPFHLKPSVGTWLGRCCTKSNSLTRDQAIGLHLRYDGKLQLTYGAANEDSVNDVEDTPVTKAALESPTSPGCLKDLSPTRSDLLSALTTAAQDGSLEKTLRVLHEASPKSTKDDVNFQDPQPKF